MNDDEKLIARVAMEMLRGLDARLRLRVEYDPLTYEDDEAAYKCHAAATDVEDAWRELEIAMQR